MARIISASVALSLLLAMSVGPAQARITHHHKALRDVEDTAAKPVGRASAKTVGSVSTAAFVENAARGDIYEIRASKLAMERSKSRPIKQFAAEMIKAHTKTTAGLKAAVAKGHVRVRVPTDLDARRQGLFNNLHASSGVEFDRRYVAQQIAAHTEALDLMKGYARHGDNKVLKAAAGKTAPLVSSHLDMARSLPGS
jgi:putative membrane protein